ncbi:MAG: PD-(D/E)XK nuclease domain-containing protein [Bacteroidales bacterium]|nr:PD-(D/E)XK nuclease domain-containing protein [Bacteroidales bacterium]
MLIITPKDSYHIESERESGYGRVDILMTPKDKNKPGFIIEMEKIRPHETTETAIEAALLQNEDRQDEATLRQQGCTDIMKVAVTLDGKRVWAKTK